MALPERKRLPHRRPLWLEGNPVYFITINCAKRHVAQLTLPEVAPEILKSVSLLNEKGNWWCSLCLLMPDHLHAFISFPPEKKMSMWVERFKSYQARYLGVDWQDGFFDHRLRNDAERQEKHQYILMNPVRAGLCDKPEDWPRFFKR